MWHFSKEFKIPAFPGRTFRIVSRSPNWRADVKNRNAVVQALSEDGQVWLDFSTIREDDLSTLRAIE